MADGMFLNPLAARQAAMQAGMISPQQLSQQGLLQQITGTMANAGTMIGGGVGGLFGAQYGSELENQARLNAYRQQQARDLAEQQSQQALRAAQEEYYRGRATTSGAGTGTERMLKHIADVRRKMLQGEAVDQADIILANDYREQLSKQKTYKDKDGNIITVSQAQVSPLPTAKEGQVVQQGQQGVRVVKTPESEKADEARIKGLQNTVDSIQGDLRNVTEAKNLSDFFSTGRLGSLWSTLDPGGRAAALEDKIKSISAAKAFDQLRALREGSTTGASGLGQVTEKEFSALENRTTSLRPGSPTYMQDLQYIENKWTELLQRAQNELASAKGEPLPFPRVSYVPEPGEGAVSKGVVVTPVDGSNVEKTGMYWTIENDPLGLRGKK